MTPLTINQLALYLGCKAYADANNGEFTTGIIAGFETHRKYYVSIKCDKYIESMWAPENIKPILRPLESISEEEAKQFLKLFAPKTYKFIDIQTKADTWFTVRFKNGNGNYGFISYSVTQMNPEKFIWLLSKGFDLFNWIEQGLAINSFETPSEPHPNTDPNWPWPAKQS